MNFDEVPSIHLADPPGSLRRRTRRLGPTARTLILGGLGMTSGLILIVIVCISGRLADEQSRSLQRRLLPADNALQDTLLATVRAENDFVAAIHTADPLERATAIAAAQQADRVQAAFWSNFRDRAVDLTGEAALRDSFEQSSTRSRQLAARLLVSDRALGEDPSAVAAQQHESDLQQAAAAALEDLYRSAILRRAAAIRAQIAETRLRVLGAYGGLGLLFVGFGLVLVRGARRDEHLLVTEAEALRTGVRRADLEASLQRGLEMERTEDSTLHVVGRALRMVAGDVPTEVLLADSSQAHFSRVISNGSEHTACRAAGPGDCPATTSGQTQAFENSARLDACPYLRDQPEAVWATCVPVSVTGRTIGVIHTRRSVDEPPRPGLADDLELVARKAGERLGALRVLARSEAQARIDPLTGLPNRRTLEDQVRDLPRDDELFVVAFADLDEFKKINDAHGHDVGDRALRLFARALSEGIRPRDFVARYGGEEFVVVLPACSLAGATAVANRIRGLLADELGHASVPAFTVTIGLAAADRNESFADVVARADQAMLRGKVLGRNRVIVAGAEDVEPDDERPDETGEVGGMT